MLVTGSLDNTLKLWNLRSKELMHSVKAEESFSLFNLTHRNNWHQGGVECLDLFATVVNSDGLNSRIPSV